MKSKLLGLLSMLCLSLASCANSDEVSLLEEKNKDIDVIVIAGQSNAVGCSNWAYLNENDLEVYRSGFENTKIRYCCDEYYNYSRFFTNVKTGQGHQANRFGPELGMAEYFEEQQDYLNKNVYLIKYGFGGTALYNRWRSPSSTLEGNQPGDLYTKFIDYCDESIALLTDQGLNPTIRAVCWMQGESDAGSTANSYKELEDNFINDVCSELSKYNNQDKIKFIDAGISQSPVWANYQVINRAKKENCELDVENRFYIDTIAEGLTYDLEPKSNPDLCHYDSASMITLGRLFAEVIIENAIIEQGVL